MSEIHSCGGLSVFINASIAGISTDFDSCIQLYGNGLLETELYTSKKLL